MSLKEVRNQLSISHDDGVINDEEFLPLYDLNMSNNVDLPYNSYPGFDFDDLADDECLSEFASTRTTYHLWLKYWGFLR